MKTIMSLVVAAGATGAMAANDVLVEIQGDPIWNAQINTGEMAGVNPGDSAVYSFELDSTNFLNSGSFPTRGYVIDPDSFQITFSGGQVVNAQNPFPSDHYFVLRDNDPAVDGFFLSGGTDFPGSIPTDEVGIFENFSARFNVSYTGDTLDSLNILDALGSYDFTGLTVFGMGINDGPFEDVIGMDFAGMTISFIPTPATLALLAPLAAFRRRR